MTNFKKTTAKAKVADAETFMARLEAIDTILQAHQDEFKAEFLRVLGDCVAIQQQEQDAADEDDDAHISVH